MSLLRGLFRRLAEGILSGAAPVLWDPRDTPSTFTRESS